MQCKRSTGYRVSRGMTDVVAGSARRLSGTAEPFGVPPRPGGRRVSGSGAASTGARGRGGFAYRGLVLALIVVLAVPAIGWSLLPRLSWSGAEKGRPMMYLVARGEFIHDVTEQGSVESANNMEITSHVESKNLSGTTILWIIDEGYLITPQDVEANKVLVELDSSALTNEKLQQDILVANSSALKIQAENAVVTATINLKEYQFGILQQSQEKFRIVILEAEEELARAKDYLTYSERLNAKGYVSDLELESDRSAVRKAQNKWALAKLDLETLDKYTQDKTVKQLEAEIATNKAKLMAQEASLTLEVEKLTRVQQQIDNCTIRVTKTGQVVYANEEGRHGQGEIVIQEGAMIRERQVIIRLPDPTQMQVKARINEGKISQIEAGMEAGIRLDAYPDRVLKGAVAEVSEYPAASGWMGPAVKEYETIIKILEPPSDLRPGYTAEVKIRVEELENVLQVPVQAIIEHGRKLYVVFHEGTKGLRAQEVKASSTNDKFVVISDGLQEGNEIVLDANSYRDELDLPKLPPEKGAGRQRPAGADDASAGPSGPARGNGPARGDRPAAEKSGSESAASPRPQGPNRPGPRP